MEKRICIALAIAILGILTAIAPHTFAKVCDIGVCGKATMHCHEVTQPTLIVLGILIILATLIQTVVLVTHDGESLKKCDEIFFMRK